MIKIFILLLFISGEVMSASCCGGAAVLPSLNLSDSPTQLSLGYSNSAIVYQSDQTGVITKRDGSNQEVSESFNLRAVKKFGEDWQFGFHLPVVSIHKKSSTRSETSTGLGDFTFQGAYEVLPELEYSVWKPRVFIFLSQTAPLGKSTYDSQKNLRTDARSGGFHKTSLGLAMAKTIGPYDWIVMADIHQGWARTFHQPTGDITVTPGPGTLALLGLGLSPGEGKSRIGTTFQYTYDSAYRTSGTIDSKGMPKYYYDLGVSLAYAFESSSLVLSYADQTLIGPAKNTLLSRSFALNMMFFID